MAYGTVNADVIGTSVAGSNLGAGNASIMKNRIINGAMVIDQRNAGASVTATTSNEFSVDRWQLVSSVSSKYTAQQNAGSVTPPAGFTNYLGITSSSAYSSGSSDYFFFIQRIEGYNTADLNWGSANAKTVTLSFWVRSSLTGTFGGALRNSDNTRSYPFSYTISSANTWTQISVTVAGDTSGTWLTTNGLGISVIFNLGTGTTYSGTAGSWASTNYTSATGATSVLGTNGATFYITGVQLEVGSSATGFEYRQYGTELSLCQRYYSRLTTFGANGQIGVGISSTTSSAWIQVSTPVNLRANPTVGFSNLTISDQVNYAPAVTSITSVGAISSGAGILCNHSAVATAFRTAILSTSTSAGYLDFSAEL